MALCLLRSRGEGLLGSIHFLLRTLSSRAESGPMVCGQRFRQSGVPAPWGGSAPCSAGPTALLWPSALQPQREPRPLGCPHLLVTFDPALPQEESASRGHPL